MKSRILVLLLPSQFLCKGDRPLRFSSLGLTTISGYLKDEQLDIFDLDAFLFKRLGRFENVFAKPTADQFLEICSDSSLTNDLFQIFSEILDFNIQYDRVIYSMPVYHITELEDEFMTYFNHALLKFLKNNLQTKLSVLGGTGVFVIDRYKHRVSYSSLVDKIYNWTLNSSEQLYELLDLPPKIASFVPKHNISNHSDLSYDTNEILQFYKLPLLAHSDRLKIASLRMSEGCVGQCAFCGLSNKKLEVYDFEYVQEFIQRHLDWGYNSFFLKNSAINSDRRLADRFCNWIIQNNLKFSWTDSARFHNTDYDFYKMCYDSGCRILCFGSEIMSNRLLKYINKKITVEKISQGLENSHRAGIWNLLNFIFGFPYETKEDVKATTDFIINSYGMINQVTAKRFYLNWNSQFATHAENFDIEILRNVVLSRKTGARIKGHDIDGSIHYRYSCGYNEKSRFASDDLEKLKTQTMSELEPFLKQYGIETPQHLTLALYSIFNNKDKVWKYVTEHYHPRIANG